MTKITNLSVGLLLFALSGGASAADDAAPCATPRAAIKSLLHWQQPEHTDLSRAAGCLSQPPGVDAAEREQRAVQLKAIFDARGLFIELNTVPADPAYVDAEGRSRAVPFSSELPELYVEKIGDRWLWSSSSVEAAAQLYRQTFIVDIESALRSWPPWLRSSFFGVAIWQLIGLALLILLGIICRAVVTHMVVSQARRLMKRLRVHWGDELMSQAASPLGLMAAAGFASLLLPILRLTVRLNQIGLFALKVLAAISAVWALYRVADLFSAWLRERAAKTTTKLDDQLVPLLNKALKIFIVAIGTVFVLQNLSVDVAGLIAGLGLGGLAFALAAKDTVANLFGSATIFADRPFHVGDWVTIGGVEGIVDSVGFRSTRLRTFYNSLLSIPNAQVADSNIDNYGARQYRRFSTTVGVTYDTTPEQIQAFVEGMRGIVEASPHTRKDYYEIHLNRFGVSSLDILVYIFFEVPTWSVELQARHNFILEVIRLAKALNVEFAFPTQTLHVDSLAEAGRSMEKATPASELLAVTAGEFGPGGARSKPEGFRL